MNTENPYAAPVADAASEPVASSTPSPTDLVVKWLRRFQFGGLLTACIGAYLIGREAKGAGASVWLVIGAITFYFGLAVFAMATIGRLVNFATVCVNAFREGMAEASAAPDEAKRGPDADTGSP